MFLLASTADANKAFWGSILGAFIGTVGAFLVALFAVWADRRKKKSEERKNQLKKYNRQLIACEVSLNEYLPTMLKNIRLLRDCAEASTPGNYMMTLPRTMELKTTDTENFISPQLINEWLTLAIRAKIVNQLIEDFTDYYKKVRDNVMLILLKKEPYDAKLISEDHKTLVAFATDVEKAVQNVTNDGVHFLSMLQLHGEIGKSKVEKFKNPKQLDNFKLDGRKIKARVNKLNKKFDVDVIFSTVK